MTNRNNIVQELKELESHLANSMPSNPYQVPAGYFEGLAERMVACAKALDTANVAEGLNRLSPVLYNAPRQMPFVVPPGYFDHLAENILSVVKNDKQSAQEEIESLSPLLGGLKKQAPYGVPDGYFETLSHPGTEKAVTKVVPLVRRKWFRYAAAAMLIGIITMGGVLFSKTTEGEATPGSLALKKFSKDLMKMDETQKDDLIDFMDAGLTGNETSQVTTPASSDEIKNLLKDVSDEELKDFQQQTEDVEDVLMTN